MRIFLISSKRFYDRIPPIAEELERLGHSVTLPNCYDDPGTEERFRALGAEEHGRWKASMIMHSLGIIQDSDAVLVLNFDKDGSKNYIGGATFLEMYDAFRLGKKIYIYNPIPEGMLKDEILGFQPVILEGNLARIA